MTFLLRALALAIVLAGSLLIGARPSSADNYYDWSRYNDLGAPSGWATYFKNNARIQLGAERRLPNGVSWRLLTDLRSGIAMPRLTWMPNRQRLLTANRLLDTVHGGEMLVEARERALEEAAAKRPLPVAHALDQWDVDLTYVGTSLMSVMSAAYATMGGPDTPGYLRGLTFDLDKGTMTTVAACHGSRSPYGLPIQEQPMDYWFVYGELLRLCDARTYGDFVSLVKEFDDARPVRHLPPTASDQTKGCIEWPQKPLVRENQEYAIYLTFSGLAVQVGGHECPIARRPDNPIIVPYHRLEPFMLPGAWRDELLSLR